LLWGFGLEVWGLGILGVDQGEGVLVGKNRGVCGERGVEVG
jgi:hypothetical protein